MRETLGGEGTLDRTACWCLNGAAAVPGATNQAPGFSLKGIKISNTYPLSWGL